MCTDLSLSSLFFLFDDILGSVPHCLNYYGINIGLDVPSLCSSFEVSCLLLEIYSKRISGSAYQVLRKTLLGFGLELH